MVGIVIVIIICSNSYWKNIIYYPVYCFNMFPMQVVGNYYGAEKRYEAVQNVAIDWPGPTPPKDVPECGFDGSLCGEGCKC